MHASQPKDLANVLDRRVERALEVLEVLRPEARNRPVARPVAGGQAAQSNDSDSAASIRRDEKTPVL